MNISSVYIERKKSGTGFLYYIVVVISGNRHYLEPSYRTRKNAETHKRRVLTEIANGVFELEDQASTVFGDWAATWLGGKERSLKPSTWASYEQTFRTHILPYLADRDIQRITPRDIQSWVNQLEEKDLAPATIGRCYRCLRACLRDAEAWGDIDKCPCRKINLPRSDRKELVFLRPEEFKLLLQHLREPERTLLCVLCFSGVRLGEALGLDWNHVNFKDNTLSIERAWNQYGGFQDPKSESAFRAVPMMPTLSERLREHYQREGRPSSDALVFSIGGSRPLDPGNTRRKLYKALAEAGLKHVTFHSMRHSFSSVLLSSGASIKALQRGLGHSTAEMTLNTYSHLIPEDLGNALLEADKYMSGDDDEDNPDSDKSPD